MVFVKNILRTFLVLTLLILSGYSIVHAAIGNPASISIGDVGVFRNVDEVGDQLWFMRYDVNYAVDPDELASDNYLMAIYDTDGTTLLFTRSLNYFQHNVISIYLTPAQALVWDAAYVVRVSANPAVFDPIIEGVNMVSRTLGEGDYYEQASFGGFILAQAQILETDWAITLLTSSGVLNTTGATFFVEAVPGLREMAPEIFQITTTYYGINRTVWNHTYEQELLDHRGEGFNRTIAGLSEWLTGSTGNSNWMGIGFAGFLAVMVGGGIFAATKNSGWSLLGAGATLPLTAWQGMYEFTILGVVIFAIVVLFGILFLMGRLG